jgi:hypothetical protein
MPLQQQLALHVTSIEVSSVAKSSGQHPYGWGYYIQALHMAAQWGQDEKIKILLDKGT